MTVLGLWQARRAGRPCRELVGDAGWRYLAVFAMLSMFACDDIVHDTDSKPSATKPDAALERAEQTDVKTGEFTGDSELWSDTDGGVPSDVCGGENSGDAPCVPPDAGIDPDAGQDDPTTPGDDRAGYTLCGDSSCGPGTYCCGGDSCATPSDCMGFPGDRCDGPEDCASGESCWAAMIANVCLPWSPIPIARCHHDSDCGEAAICASGTCEGSETLQTPD
jgi:hypothetical protein